MAKIFNPPACIEAPKISFSNIQGYREACKKFEEDLKQWCIDRAAKAGITDENICEIIRFPVADGNAEYMVASLKPVQLIHLPLWDAWEFSYAHRLTKKDIVEKIQQQNNLKKLFGS